MNCIRHTKRVLALALTGCTLAGMVSATGCGSPKVETRSTTTGQELQDLEEARNKGLLTEEEYGKQREEILKRK